MGAKVAMDLDLFNVLTRSKAPLTTNALAEAIGAEKFLLSKLCMEHCTSVPGQDTIS